MDTHAFVSPDLELSHEESSWFDGLTIGRYAQLTVEADIEEPKRFSRRGYLMHKAFTGKPGKFIKFLHKRLGITAEDEINHPRWFNPEFNRKEETHMSTNNTFSNPKAQAVLDKLSTLMPEAQAIEIITNVQESIAERSRENSESMKALKVEQMKASILADKLTSYTLMTGLAVVTTASIYVVAKGIMARIGNSAAAESDAK